MNQNLINVVKQLRESTKQQESYLYALPREFQELLVDNEYTNQYDIQRTAMIQALFGDLTEDIEWFLYEFEPGKSKGPHLRYPDGTEFTFTTDDDYYKYLETI